MAQHSVLSFNFSVLSLNFYCWCVSFSLYCTAWACYWIWMKWNEWMKSKQHWDKLLMLTEKTHKSWKPKQTHHRKKSESKPNANLKNVHMCVCITMHNCRLQYSTEQFWLLFLVKFGTVHFETRWKVLWESTTPRKSLPNGAAYMGPFRHLGTLRSPIVGTIWLIAGLPLLPHHSTDRNKTRTWSSLSP